MVYFQKKLPFIKNEWNANLKCTWRRQASWLRIKQEFGLWGELGKREEANANEEYSVNELTRNWPHDVHWFHFFFNFYLRYRRDQNRGEIATHSCWWWRGSCNGSDGWGDGNCSRNGWESDRWLRWGTSCCDHGWNGWWGLLSGGRDCNGGLIIILTGDGLHWHSDWSSHWYVDFWLRFDTKTQTQRQRSKH